MSSHSVTKIDQKEYLKKYLSGDKEKKKKKKDKKHKKSESSIKVKIIDDDINHMDCGLQIDEELLLTGDDAPQIVGEYIEETSADSKIPKWKSFAIKDEPVDHRVAKKDAKERNLWGLKVGDIEIKPDFSNKSPDNSPPRRKYRKHHSPSNSTPSRSFKSTSPSRRLKTDNSPLRRRQNDTPDYSPDRVNKEKCNFKQSPPRKSKSKHSPDRNSTRSRKGGQLKNSSDHSPRRNTRYSPDISPPRQKKSPISSTIHKTRNSHQSPLRKGRNTPIRDRGRSPDQSSNRHRRNSGKSPPRKAKNSPNGHRRRSPIPSPTRQRRDSDYSPQRKRNHLTPTDRKRTSDQTSPRRRRDSDQSPPRKHKNSPRRDSKKSPPRRRRDSDQSPPRSSRYLTPTRVKREKPSNDLSPARQSKIKRKSSSPSLPRQPPPIPPRRSRWERRDSEKSVSPPPTHKPKSTKTLEGKKAGLQDAQALQKETLERRKQEELLFEKMPSDISGRNAEIQVRSTGRQGRRAREAKAEDPEERRRKEAHEEKKKQLYERWGKGLKQIEDHKNRLAEQEHESSKPLARYSNDEDLERHLREQERVDDPMLQYMREKRKEKEKQSGKPEVPIYKGSFPENRFGIRPGYRWDGVDRSNGYEKKYFDVQNEKRARQDEAYKYSVEDM